MNVISERFPGFGIVFKAKIALKIEEMSAIPSTGSSLIALLLIWSCPGAFLGLRRWINSLTSREVKGLMGRDIWKGECRYSVISGVGFENVG